MAVKKVACPHCGEVANITVNSKDEKITKIASSKNVGGAGNRDAYESACKECGKTFYYWLE